MTKILLATNNRGKIIELEDLLKELGLELILPSDIGLNMDVLEDGRTYSDNARKKAAAFAAGCGFLALADDSGLEVQALGGKPGLHSKRYTSELDASDADRRALLIKNLRGKARPWRAEFHAAVAIADPAGGVTVANGICPGEIIPEQRGTGGFGYDPIFLVDGTGKTMAELSLDEKNRLSHRARALANAIPTIKKLISS